MLLKTASRTHRTACLPNTRFTTSTRRQNRGPRTNAEEEGCRVPTRRPACLKRGLLTKLTRSLQLAQVSRPRSPPGDPGTAPTTASHSAPLAQASGPRGRLPPPGCRPSPPRLGRSRQPLAPRAAEKPGGELREPGKLEGPRGRRQRQARLLPRGPASSADTPPPPAPQPATRRPPPSRAGPQPQRRASRKSRPRSASSAPRAAPAGSRWRGAQATVALAAAAAAAAAAARGQVGLPLGDLPCGPPRKSASPGQGWVTPRTLVPWNRWVERLSALVPLSSHFLFRGSGRCSPRHLCPCRPPAIVPAGRIFGLWHPASLRVRSRPRLVTRGVRSGPPAPVSPCRLASS